SPFEPARRSGDWKIAPTMIFHFLSTFIWNLGTPSAKLARGGHMITIDTQGPARQAGPTPLFGNSITTARPPGGEELLGQAENLRARREELSLAATSFRRLAT